MHVVEADWESEHAKQEATVSDVEVQARPLPASPVQASPRQESAQAPPEMETDQVPSDVSQMASPTAQGEEESPKKKSLSRRISSGVRSPSKVVRGFRKSLKI